MTTRAFIPDEGAEVLLDFTAGIDVRRVEKGDSRFPGFPVEPLGA